MPRAVMARSLRSNTLAGAGEQVVVGIAFFLFYGILIRAVGTELVGVLSLILVLASIGSLGGAGFASALSHFVPAFESQGDRAATVRCVETTLLCTAVLYAVTVAVTYVPFARMIGAQAGPDYAVLVQALMLPASLHVLMIGVGSTAAQALTAMQRNDLRLWASLAGAFAGLAMLVGLVERYGVLVGMWALLAQSATIAGVSWLLLRRVMPGLAPLPWRLDRTMARRLFGLGANMQAQTLALAAVEPVVRLVIGHFGSLSAVAIFSMANRFVIQMRALIYAGLQPLLSALSHARAQDEAAVSQLYERARALTQVTAVACLSAATGAAPFVEEIWTGGGTTGFVLYTGMLCAGWLANSLALPSYFNAYSLGRMTPSLRGHLLLLALTVGLSVPLAYGFGSDGAVAGLAAALTGSAAYLIIANGAFVPRLETPAPQWAGLVLFVSAAFAAAGAILAYDWARPSAGPFPAGICSGLAWLLLMAPSLWLHPASRELLEAALARLGRQTAN